MEKEQALLHVDSVGASLMDKGFLLRKCKFKNGEERWSIVDPEVQGIITKDQNGKEILFEPFI